MIQFLVLLLLMIVLTKKCLPEGIFLLFSGCSVLVQNTDWGWELSSFFFLDTWLIKIYGAIIINLIAVLWMVGHCKRGAYTFQPKLRKLVHCDQFCPRGDRNTVRLLSTFYEHSKNKDFSIHLTHFKKYGQQNNDQNTFRKALNLIRNASCLWSNVVLYVYWHTYLNTLRVSFISYEHNFDHIQSNMK